MLLKQILKESKQAMENPALTTSTSVLFPQPDCVPEDIPTLLTHLAHLDEVLRLLEAAQLTINPTKCVFGIKSLDFLGHRVDDNGI